MPQNTEIKYRKDYQPPHYHIDSVMLTVEIGEDHTTVESMLSLHRSANVSSDTPLVLHGEHQELKSILLNEKIVSKAQYQLSATELIINDLPEHFSLKIRSLIKPQLNTALEGLYKSQDMFCTQCEPNGFRRITYYLDRPDVMASFTTKIIADKTLYPVLLSNGNKIDSGLLDNNKHFATWHDPFKKPSYLFALVAGDLAVLKDSYTTASGRPVATEIYARKHDIEKCHYAMEALKQSMRWDEVKFGREYDLDIYMIVAVSDFNMGAMENKGLNLFNTKYVLVNPLTSTDLDYQNVQAVIGHEYFHNWTGNRITCRDWFQLSLKEGLTVFRDEEFTADHHSRSVKRIEDVKIIRSAQFSEDASPMAHPIRPDSYIEMNNFYTVTVYNKGAEVIRMQHTILGTAGFRKGMDLYFDTFDGQAVTCDDFVACMEKANSVDLEQFRLWYSQAGTPSLSIHDKYDAAHKTYSLHIAQSCPATAAEPQKPAFDIPIKLGLLGKNGHDLKVEYDGKLGTNHVLRLTHKDHTFVFKNVAEKPIPSLLRDFSAPVKLEYAYSDDQLLFLFAHDSNEFNRWDAGQIMASRILLNIAKAYREQTEYQIPKSFIEAIHHILRSSNLDKSLVSEAITLPSERTLAETMATIDVDAIHFAREHLIRTIGKSLQDPLFHAYNHLQLPGHYQIDSSSIAMRRLRNTCLGYLIQTEHPQLIKLCQTQFSQANNMTDQLAALHYLANVSDADIRAEVLAKFYHQWQHEPLVVDKWLTIQASTKHSDTIANVESLLTHPAFDYKNPNKVYALLSSFTANQAQFHREDGKGYQLIVEQIKLLDKINPMVAARLARALMSFKRYDEKRQQLMKQALEEIAAIKNLSKDVYEIVKKSLHS
ncbi:MAG: aminopeptidase N [Gammaproteobacteria bacterium]|nr:aminopeptidase N [Gammaproteobacteria bacterium]